MVPVRLPFQVCDLCHQWSVRPLGKLGGGVIKTNPNQRMTDTTTPKPEDGKEDVASSVVRPCHPNRRRLVQATGSWTSCDRAAPLVFSLSDSVSTESIVSDPELSLDRESSEMAPWVWMTSACHAFGYE